NQSFSGPTSGIGWGVSRLHRRHRNHRRQLDDGRALLLGEVIDGDGVRRDIALKGSGRTPYSRSGDGSVLREYVVSEAMAALDIPTTRALAAVTTGDQVYREDIVPGAVLARGAQGHIRVGTFQYFAAREEEVRETFCGT
ncbi:MAG TPA: hypothetical protein ENI69_04745, partial [Rhodospirillales bacterium]|nr:hypothetical protein [Rhodospirillales bacterium]